MCLIVCVSVWRPQCSCWCWSTCRSHHAGYFFHHVGFTNQNTVIRLSSRWDISPAPFKNNFIRMFWCKLNEIFIFLRIVMNWNSFLSGGLLTEMNTLVLERSREQHVLPSFSLQTQQTATTQAFSLQSCCLFLTL